MKIRVVAALNAEELAGVGRTIAEATAADDRSPVSEATLLHLRRADEHQQVQHVLAEADGRVVGYGVLLPIEGPQPRVAELAVCPPYRGRGIGHTIITRLLDLVAPLDLALWAHGRDSHAAPLARSMGFDRQRTLLQMRRSLTRQLPTARFPDGYAVRTFAPGADDAVFLAANAAAFTDLPDQGGWNRADLEARLTAPWFDAGGFFLLHDASGALAGFHWTKEHRPESLGEIYVLAVVPGFQGKGLATPLAVHGLRHLRARGMTTAMLYVDESNGAAVGLYERLGFGVWDVDVLYVRAAAGHSAG